MPRQTTAQPRRVLALLASTTLAVGGFTGAGAAAATPAFADAPASSERTARFEVDFLTGMIDHHAMAVMMAQMCTEKAVHPELASMCESIVASQSAQIEQMQGWLQAWYGVSHEPQMSGMGAMHRLMVRDGEKFEVVFMRSMIRHHWSAVREAGRCLDNAEHAELRGLCSEISSAQLAEIQQMQTWLREWYGLPGGRPVDAV